MRHIRLIQVVLVTCLLLGVWIVPSTSAREPVVVFPYADGWTFDAHKNQDILVRWGWFAATQGLVNAYMEADHKDYTLMDAAGNVVLYISEEEAQQYFLEPFPLAPEEAGLECPMPQIWLQYWVYELGKLPAGTYTLQMRVRLDHPVNDGFHLCTEDGEPIVQPPSLTPPYEKTFTVYIDV